MKKIVIYLLFTIFSSTLYSQVEVTVPAKSDDFYSRIYNIIVFEENGLKGLKDTLENKLLVEAKYTAIKDILGGICYEISDGKKKGMYSVKHNKVTIPVEYTKIEPKEIMLGDKKENRAYLIEKNGKFGLLDGDFKTILNLEYDEFKRFNNRYVIVRKNKLEGAFYFDCNDFKIPIKYNKVYQSYPLLALIASYKGMVDFYSRDGELISKNLRSVERFWNKFDTEDRFKALVRTKKNKIGLYDTKNNNFILPTLYSSIYENYYGCYIAKKKNKFGVVDKENKILIEFQYDSLFFLKPFRFRWDYVQNFKKQTDSIIVANMKIGASIKGECGLLNRKGDVIVDFDYSEVEHVNYFYKIKKNDKYYIVNTLGEQITDSTFDDVGLFMWENKHIKAAVFNDGRMGYIDALGNFTEPINRESKAVGYKELRVLCNDFVEALKAEDDLVLYEFCKKLEPDEYTGEFMQRIRFNYRSFPNKFFEKGYHFTDLVDASYRTLLHFKNYLKAKNHLQDLRFVGFSREFYGYVQFSDFYTLATEEPLILESNGEKYRYKLGELINIDGYWKSFTKSRRL